MATLASLAYTNSGCSTPSLLVKRGGHLLDQKLISNIKVFDVYEGDNINENQKSIALSVTIQSLEKTLNDSDLEKINKSIIETVENKTGAKIRS